MLETEEKDGKGRSQAWKEQFEVVVEKMEGWAARMREILEDEGVGKLVAEREGGEGGEAGKSV